MDPLLIALIVIVAVVILALVIVNNRRQHSEKLHSEFGDEYDRTVENADSRHAAEQALEARKERVARYDIRPLTAQQRDRYAGRWEDVQSEFVDHPDNAVRRAHSLIDDVMRDKGYPIDDFDHQYEDLSVNHPTVVKEYRAGHEIVARHEQGDATTEEMRRAMIHYRTLFDELMRDAAQPAGNALGDRDRDGTPNALDSRDTAAAPPRTPADRPMGDRDGDGTPNALDTRDGGRIDTTPDGRPVAPPSGGARSAPLGDRDGDGTPNAIDRRD